MPLTDADRFAALTPEQQAAALAAAAGSPPEPLPTGVDDFAELTAFYDDTLPLRYAGHDYVVHAPDVELGLLCQRVVSVGWGALVGRGIGKRALKAQALVDDVLDDDTEEALYLRLLGHDQDHPRYDPARDVWRQLEANGAPWPVFKLMGTTVFMWAGYDRQEALEFWRSGGRPKAPEPTPPAVKAPQDRRPKAGTGGATSTKRRGSSSSTARTTKKGAKATPGPTS